MSKLVWVLLLLVSPFSDAFAAEATERAPNTVYVTAEKREENIQEVPGSISALSGLYLEDAGIGTLEKLSHHVPNFVFSGWGANSHNFAFMRGIGAVHNEPAIGFNIDGVGYFDTGMFNFPLYDVERVEVLRGPQGTLYGRNSLAGVVNIITRKPDNRLSATVSGGAGDHGLLETSASVSAPLIQDSLYLRMSGFAKSRDGFQRNTNPDGLGKEGDHVDAKGGRLKLIYAPCDDLEIALNLDGQTQKTGAYPLRRMTSWPVFGLPADAPWTYSHNVENKAESDLWGASLHLDWDLPFGRLTSITAYRSWDNLEINDQDFSPLDITRFRSEIDSEQVTQELRLASVEGSEPFKWLVGAYLFNSDKTTNGIQFFDSQAALFGLMPGLSQAARSKVTDSGYAWFGQLTRTFFDQLDVTGGLRYEYHKNKYRYDNETFLSGVSLGALPTNRGSDSGDILLPKVSIAWRAGVHLMPYASVARGYRSGGFNHNAPSAASVRFGPEYTWNYELGLKTSWFNDRLLVNLAGYYITLDNQQVTLVMPVGSSGTYVDNAGAGESRGLELETRIKVLPGLDLMGGFSVNKATFSSYQDGESGADYKGNRFPIAPSYQYNLAAQYRSDAISSVDLFGRKHEVNLVVRGDLMGMGDFYWDAGNALRQKAYELVNFRVGLESDHVDLHLWLDNAFDTVYQIASLQRPNLPVFGQDGAPRTLGVTLTARF